MALIKCKECNNEISSQAKTCPRCGFRIKPIHKGLIASGLLLLTAAIFIAVNSNNSDDNYQPIPQTVLTPPQNVPLIPQITKSSTESENLFLIRALEMGYTQWPQLNETSDINAVHKWISDTRYLLSSVQGRIEGRPKQLDPRINSLYKKYIELLTKYEEVLIEISSIKGISLNSDDNVSGALGTGAGVIQAAMMTGIGTVPAIAAGTLVAIAGMSPDPKDDVAIKNQKEHIKMRANSINNEFKSAFQNAKVLANELKNDSKYQWGSEVGFDDSLTTGISISEQNRLRPRDPFVLLLLAKNNLQVSRANNPISMQDLKLNSLQVYEAANDLVPVHNVYKPFKAELVFNAAELAMEASIKQLKGNYSNAPVSYAKDTIDLYNSYLKLAPNGDGTKYEYAQLARALAMDGKYGEAIGAANIAIDNWENDWGFCYRYARLTSLTNQVENTKNWIERAYRLGYNNVQFVRDDPDLKNFRENKPDDFNILTIAKAKITIDFGSFNDDILLKNNSPFTLTNVHLTGKIKQYDTRKEWPIDLNINSIKPYDIHKWTDAVSITNSRYDSFEVQVTCDQQSPLC
ncbi:MAG: zinc ribbon domain-containing protein [Methylococcaceae bacterium]